MGTIPHCNRGILNTQHHLMTSAHKEVILGLQEAISVQNPHLVIPPNQKGPRIREAKDRHISVHAEESTEHCRHITQTLPQKRKFTPKTAPVWMEAMPQILGTNSECQLRAELGAKNPLPIQNGSCLRNSSTFEWTQQHYKYSLCGA